MPYTDPRLWSIRHPRIMLMVFVGLTALFVWGNGRVNRGGILDRDVILQSDDPIRQMDQYVQEKVAEGFEGREFIPFILNSGSIRAPQGVQKILQLTETAKKVFGDTVVSLATVPAYHDTGDALTDEPFVTARDLASPDFRME